MAFRASSLVRRQLYRRPGESRDPPFSCRATDKWVPTFAGTTAENGIPSLFRIRLLRGVGVGEGGDRHAAVVDPQDTRISREIALERIWRAIEFPNQARRKATANVAKPKLHFRDGSKAAQVYALLCRPEGVTVRELQTVTGWQRHTVRGFLSASVRKQSSRVRSFQRAGERVYQVKS